MRHVPSRLLAASAVIALAAALGACAQPDAEATSAPAPPEAASSAQASADATAPAATEPPTERETEPGAVTGPASPTADWSRVVSRNGSVTMRVPAGWQVQDDSGLALGPEGLQQWNTELWLTGPDGTISYTNGAWDDVGVAAEESGVVEQRDLGGGLAAVASWERWGADVYRATVGVAAVGSDAATWFRVAGDERLHTLQFGGDAALDGFPSREAVEAHLASPAVALALDVLSTFEISDAGSDAVPTDVGITHEGVRYLPYTTPTGASRFLVPQHWRIEERLSSGPAHDGREVWTTLVTLYGPHSQVDYQDYEGRAAHQEAWEWSLGELRPTADGWHAASWRLGEAGPYFTGGVGVSLTDRAGAELPHGLVCRPTMCRAFGSGVHMPQWLGLASQEEWFGSAAEEELLTIVASLEALHDDATRR